MSSKIYPTSIFDFDNIDNIDNSDDTHTISSSLNIFLSKKLVYILFILFILSLIFYSWYEKNYDNDKLDKSYWELVGINIALAISGLVLTIIGNYITESYSLRYLDDRINILSELTKQNVSKTITTVGKIQSPLKKFIIPSPIKKNKISPIIIDY